MHFIQFLIPFFANIFACQNHPRDQSITLENLTAEETMVGITSNSRFIQSVLFFKDNSNLSAPVSAKSYKQQVSKPKGHSKVGKKDTFPANTLANIFCREFLSGMVLFRGDILPMLIKVLDSDVGIDLVRKCFHPREENCFRTS